MNGLAIFLVIVLGAVIGFSIGRALAAWLSGDLR